MSSRGAGTAQGHPGIYQRGQRKSSWTVVYYVPDASGKKHQRWKAFRTLEQARAFKSKVATITNEGGTVPDGKLTVGEYLNQWIRDRQGLSPLTLRSYREIADTHLIPSLGGVRLVGLTPPTLNSYIRQKVESGLSSATARKHIAVLKAALESALREGLVSRNVAKLIESPNGEKPPARVLDREGASIFLKAARSSRFITLYLAAMLTGKRLGELLALRWEDVDFLEGRLTIQRSYSRLTGRKKEGVVPADVFKSPKSKSSRRSVPMTDELAGALQEHKTRQERQKATLGDAYQDQGLVFAQENGLPIRTAGVIRKGLNRTLKAAKLPAMRFHDLRHSVASLLLGQNVNPKIVQMVLGHSSVAVTMDVYSHAVEGLEREALESLSSLITPKDDKAIAG